MGAYRGRYILALGLWLAASAAVAEGTRANGAPLSAIDWLSESVTPAPRAARPPAPPVTGVTTPEITVQPLDGPSPDVVGLLPSDVTGLPTTLWSSSPEPDVVAALRATPVPSLPALQEMLIQLMLAEAAPPAGAAPAGNLFLARVDKLLQMGALDPAQSLIEASDVARPEVFRRWFDTSLLTGTEDFACTRLNAMPAIAPTLATRVFCLARAGDWPAAALILNGALSLGAVTPAEEQLLTLFLDPELAEEEELLLPPPATMTPLDFRMREAIGEAIPTATLPRAFANADLRSMIAWRYQLEAAERLSRAGAVSENALVGFYTLHVPAASGGVWDRAAAVQDFDFALKSGGTDAALNALPALMEAARSAKVEVPLARFYQDVLTQADVLRAGNAAAFAMGLLSPAYEAVAAAAGNPDSHDALLVAIARGQLTEATPTDGWADNNFVAPIQAAFTQGEMTSPARDLIAAGRLGEGLLSAISAAEDSLTGDPATLGPALSALRSVGLEDVARRIALQVLLLDRAG
ncbi:hypothetical protein BVG79_00845 [Ketogulonicigenium robustum]|uniref:Antifreeze glycopeptide polyprotein n=1 Tax=Ketogulonicigenium robustum TaxID=92947 RepID=A0A1W6NYU6_9RHOB|nr:hypothetical protein [Ketogulonicigenium robustum]ARO14197.1 hypothetical protein BVG79_00845 [Ketogulonicigenium robustum]